MSFQRARRFSQARAQRLDANNDDGSSVSTMTVRCVLPSGDVVMEFRFPSVLFWLSGGKFWSHLYFLLIFDPM
jgi:hypothetical protein